MCDCRAMEVIFQRRCAKCIYVVPQGLRELMSDISREVLREQPTEIYCFIADYLDCLFITRENAKVAALFVENTTETGGTIADIIERTGLSMKQAIRAARIIQRAFRRYLREKEGPIEDIEPIDPRVIMCKMILRLKISHETANASAKIIQRAWRFYQIRLAGWKSRYESAVDWRAAARYTLHLYKPHVTLFEAHKAATTIKAAYRGYYTRQLLKHMAEVRDKDMDILSYLEKVYKEGPKEEGGSTVSSRTIEILYHDYYASRHDAAKIIQQAYRKYLIRKQIKKGEFKGMTQKQYFREYWNVNTVDTSPFASNRTIDTVMILILNNRQQRYHFLEVILSLDANNVLRTYLNVTMDRNKGWKSFSETIFKLYLSSTTIPYKKHITATVEELETLIWRLIKTFTTHI